MARRRNDERTFSCTALEFAFCGRELWVAECSEYAARAAAGFNSQGRFDFNNRTSHWLLQARAGVVKPFAGGSPDFSYQGNAEKVLVGTFSLYPADRPGKFMLGPAEAFRKFSETRKSSEDVRLVFEMKLPAENKPAVEVTIESPNWGDKKV